MIMAGYAFMDAPPFHTVYLHGTVRDMNHVKMSKSLGNGIDPLDVVANYGADALRYTVIAGMGIMGADLMLDPHDLERSFAPGRNFATKLWNIGRFLLGNVGTSPVRSIDELRDAELTLADRWILGRLNATILECDAALGPARPEKGKWRPEERYAGLRLSEYAEAARRFVWGDVADWYLETTKGRIGGGPDSEVARAVLTHVFDFALRLLHPIMPFITETLWQRLPFPVATDRCEFLAIAPWPIPHPVSKTDSHDMSRFDVVREAVTAVRQIRSDYAIPPGRVMDAIIHSRTNGELFMEHSALIGRLSRSAVRVGVHSVEGGAAHSVLADGSEVIIPLGGLVDLSKECDKLRADLEQLELQLNALSKRLQNEGFTSRAPANVVASERKKEEEWTKRREQLSEKVKALCGG